MFVWVIKMIQYGKIDFSEGIDLNWYFRYFRYFRSADDERHFNRWKQIVSRFKGKLVKMIKTVNGKFDDYLISPQIRQILLHWGYELTKRFFCYV